MSAEQCVIVPDERYFAEDNEISVELLKIHDTCSLKVEKQFYKIQT